MIENDMNQSKVNHNILIYANTFDGNFMSLKDLNHNVRSLLYNLLDMDGPIIAFL